MKPRQRAEVERPGPAASPTATSGVEARRRNESVASRSMPYVGGITLLSLVLGFLFLGDKSFWLDEGYSFAYAQFEWPGLWRVVSTSQANMSLYYVLLHVWLGLGTSEFVIRALSVVFVAGTVPLLYAVGRRLLGEFPAVLACLLFAINSFAVRFAQEARGYSLAVFLATLSTLLFVRAWDKPSGMRWLAYTLVGGIAAYSHFFVGFVIAAHLVTLVVGGRPRPPTRTLIATYGGIALMAAPLILFVFTRSKGQISWIPRPTPAGLVRAFEDLSGGAGPWLPLVYVAAAGTGAILAGTALRARQLERWPVVLVAGWFAIPVLGSFLGSFAKPIFVSKYLIVALPALALGAAFGIANLRGKWTTAGAVAIVVGLSALGLVSWYSGYEKDDWRGAASFLMESARPGDGILVIPTRVRKPLEYYVVERLRAARSAPDPVYPPQEWGTYATKAPKGAGLAVDLQRRVAGHDRVWLVASRGSKELRRTAARALAVDFLPTATRDFTHITLKLYIAR